MNKEIAIKNIKRMIYNLDAIRTPFTWEFVHTTKKNTSQSLFIESIKTCGANVISTNEYYIKGIKHYETKVALPDFVQYAIKHQSNLR